MSKFSHNHTTDDRAMTIPSKTAQLKMCHMPQNILTKAFAMLDGCRYHSLREMELNARINGIWDVNFYKISTV